MCHLSDLLQKILRISSSNAPFHRAVISEPADQRTRVDPRDSWHIVLSQKLINRSFALSMARVRASLLDCVSPNLDLVGLGVDRVDSIVADHRVRRYKYLAAVGRVCERFLITRHPSGENHLAEDISGSPESLPLENCPILED